MAPKIKRENGRHGFVSRIAGSGLTMSETANRKTQKITKSVPKEIATIVITCFMNAIWYFSDRTVFILMISRNDIKQENFPRMREIPRRDKEFPKKVRVSMASVPEKFRAGDNSDIADGEADMAVS